MRKRKRFTHYQLSCRFVSLALSVGKRLRLGAHVCGLFLAQPCWFVRCVVSPHTGLCLRWRICTLRKLLAFKVRSSTPVWKQRGRLNAILQTQPHEGSTL